MKDRRSDTGFSVALPDPGAVHQAPHLRDTPLPSTMNFQVTVAFPHGVFAGILWSSYLVARWPRGQCVSSDVSITARGLDGCALAKFLLPLRASLVHRFSCPHGAALPKLRRGPSLRESVY